MTRKTLEYILRHFEMSNKAFMKNCVIQNCKGCPFLNHNYCEKKIDIGENMGLIRRHLEKQKLTNEPLKPAEGKND